MIAAVVASRHAVPRYVALALVLLGANYVWLATLVGAGLPLLLSKVVTEVSLYIVSFAVQRSIVFARRGSSVAESSPATDALAGRGQMLKLSRNTLAGSHMRLISRSRARVSGGNASSIRASAIPDSKLR